MEQTKTFVLRKVKTKLTKWLKIFRSFCKNLGDQARMDRPKIVESEAEFQAKEGSSIQGVSCELVISQSSRIRHLYSLSENIRIWQIVPYATRILQNFFHTLVEIKYICIYIYIYIYMCVCVCVCVCVYLVFFYCVHFLQHL